MIWKGETIEEEIVQAHAELSGMVEEICLGVEVAIYSLPEVLSFAYIEYWTEARYRLAQQAE